MPSLRLFLVADSIRRIFIPLDFIWHSVAFMRRSFMCGSFLLCVPLYKSLPCSFSRWCIRPFPRTPLYNLPASVHPKVVPVLFQLSSQRLYRYDQFHYHYHLQLLVNCWQLLTYFGHRVVVYCCLSLSFTARRDSVAFMFADFAAPFAFASRSHRARPRRMPVLLQGAPCPLLLVSGRVSSYIYSNGVSLHAT